MSISAVIITRNEEDRIERCLESLSWCDEIVVVDSGSTDGTVEVARRFTSKVFVEEWKGFGPQKQSALGRAASEWVLSIDADEEVTAELSEEIRRVIGGGGGKAGYLIPRRNLYGGKWLRFGGQYPDLVLRLFRRERGRFSESPVHERVVVEGDCGRLSSPIIHYAFRDLSSMVRKLDDYSTLAAMQLYRDGCRAGVLTPLTHAVSLWVKDYLLRLGFMDGWEGFNVALLKSLGAYFKYAKLRELRAGGGGRP
ncbi:MAG TPA: glycosyltransferase family 2 protein [Nitrospirae bacterium]|nr:glycosyltransferase family 2 protein [Nitrospirota bacterium]